MGLGGSRDAPTSVSQNDRHDTLIILRFTCWRKAVKNAFRTASWPRRSSAFDNQCTVLLTGPQNPTNRGNGAPVWGGVPFATD